MAHWRPQWVERSSHYPAGTSEHFAEAAQVVCLASCEPRSCGFGKDIDRALYLPTDLMARKQRCTIISCRRVPLRKPELSGAHSPLLGGWTLSALRGGCQHSVRLAAYRLPIRSVKD